MKKLLLSCAVFLFAAIFPVTCLFADNYGERIQRQYAKYTKDTNPDDAYIILKDRMVVELDKDCNFKSTEYKMYKVLREEGKFMLGEKELSFDEAFETIEDIKAVTISPEGEEREASQIQEISPYSGFPMYSSHKLKVISLPAVVENSIIEISWTTKGRRLFKGEYWGESYFQITVPILDSSYKITLPSDKKLYTGKMNLDIAPIITESKDTKFTTYYWQMKDVEKIELEEMAPSLFNVVPQVAVSTIESWDRLGKLEWDLFKDKIIQDRAISEAAKKLTKDKKTDMEKLEAILKYMQDNFRYVSLSFGRHAMEPHKAGITFANKYGDCKDQCACLAAMLKAVGIQSLPVLVNYISNEPVLKDLPAPSYFSHVVLKVIMDDGKELLIDPLVRDCASEDMHITLDATDLFFFNGTEARLKRNNLPDPLNYTRNIETSVILNTDGSASGEIKLTPAKTEERSYREMFKQMTEKKRGEFCEGIISLTAPEGRVIDFSHADPEDYRERFYMSVKIDAPNFVAITGDYIILELAEFGNTASFSKPERTQPIVSYFPRTNLSEYTYVLPKGYKVEYLPDSFSYSTPLDEFSSAYRIEDGKVKVKHRASLKVVNLPSSAYKRIRQAYNKISKEGKKRIILKKNAE